MTARAFFRAFAGTFLGLIVGFALIVGVEGFSALVHPLPKDFGGTMEEMCRHVERYPQWVLSVVVPMWAMTALLGTWIARRVGNIYAAGVVGMMLLVGLALNLSKLPY
jgi:hypothetical protein